MVGHDDDRRPVPCLRRRAAGRAGTGRCAEPTRRSPAARASVLSFGEADALVERLAAALFATGVRKDDVVLVQLPNIVEIVLAFLACARLGAIVSPVMLAYGERDLRRIVRHVRPAAYLTLARWRDGRPAEVAARLAAEDSRRPFTVLALGDEAGAAPGVVSRSTTSETCRATSPHCAPTSTRITIDANEIVTMHWTSGTTGDPKCVPRSHNQWHGTGHACTDARCTRAPRPDPRADADGAHGRLQRHVHALARGAGHAGDAPAFRHGSVPRADRALGHPSHRRRAGDAQRAAEERHARRPRRELDPQHPVRLGTARSVDDRRASGSATASRSSTRSARRKA